MEEWKWIKGYSNSYKIYPDGKIVSLKKGSNANLSHFMRNGYKRIHLSNSGKAKTYTLHRLVAEYFIPNPENKPFVNHIDGDKLNCHYTNLEWNTQKENVQHAWRIGLNKPVNGERQGHSALTEEQVVLIRSETNLTQAELAKKYGVIQPTISQILRRKTWKHLEQGPITHKTPRPRLSLAQKQLIIARAKEGKRMMEICREIDVPSSTISFFKKSALWQSSFTEPAI